jgi:beta-glucosidase/6-phospho-beta-glucosidase/beta-galactosidase
MPHSFVTAGDGGPFAAPIAQAHHVNPAPDRFMFATGIECSAPTIENGRLRRDLLAECGHYDRWQEDLLLVRDLGLTYLRYGLPYHKIHLGPGRYDWSFADVVMQEMLQLRIIPILDLLHFGVPDWLGNFQNPELPLHFADYAEAVARRYPWVRYFTPVNEIYVSARISAKDGLWNEQLRTDQGFVTALKHLVTANILATHGIVAATPDAVLIPSESAEYMHEGRLAPSAEAVDFNRQRFISLDLLYGRPCEDHSRTYLLDSGMTVPEYDWFMTSQRSGHHILGIDYYGRNEHIISPTGRRVPVEDVFGLHAMAKEYYDRYAKPLMHTETNSLRGEDCPAWLWKQWMNIMRLRRDGVPILGFTWYSLVDQIDWDIALSERRGTVNQCGLFDLDRRPNPVAAEYRAMVQEFENLPLYPMEALSAAA